MTPQVQSKVHLAMSEKGYVSLGAAAVALRCSRPAVARRMAKTKLKTMHYGSAVYVLWGELRKAFGPAADLLNVPKDAREVCKLDVADAVKRAKARAAK